MPENVSTSRIYAQSGLGVAPASAAWFFVQNPTVTTFFLDSLSYEPCYWEPEQFFRELAREKYTDWAAQINLIFKPNRTNLF